MNSAMGSFKTSGLRSYRDMVAEAPEDFRVRTSVYSDPAVFEDEMERIFETSWIYVAHESEVSEPGDYITTYMGRQPVIVSRGDDGEIHIMYNTCRHRGNAVCRQERGNSPFFRCPYHGWLYKNTGELVGITEKGRYPDGFGQELTGLLKVPRVAGYRGLVFASLSPRGESLDEFLGPLKRHIDLWAELSPTGRIRVLPPHKFLFSGNWKYQMENTVEGYHAWFVHQSAFNVMKRSLADRGDYGGEKDEGRVIGFKYGHAVMERPGMTSMDKAAFADYMDCLVKSYGAERARQITYGRNVWVFPNLGLLENNIRVLHPLAVDKTEMHSFFFLMEGVPDHVNTDNLRDSQWRRGTMGFVNTDDLEMFSSSQGGVQGTKMEWIYLSKGIHDEISHPNGERVGRHIHDETALRAMYREWIRLMAPEEH